MQTVEIPHEDWVKTLNEFTVIHEGWLVSLDVIGPEIGAQPEINDLPLIGVSLEGIGQDGGIVISAARSAPDHITHTVRGATHIYIERTDEGAVAALGIESTDGVRTILRIRSPHVPEEVDGVERH